MHHPHARTDADRHEHRRPDIPYLRRLMADALDEGKMVLIVPPESASFLWEELELEPEEFSERELEGYMEVSEPVTEGHPVYGGLFVRPGSGEHATGTRLAEARGIPRG